ncbi:MAG: hypothetical protein JO320_18835 [Alphaproteobacteria bacterium]|nr:hypothetical protein [Alphaproteobacteria bacterium]
MAQVGSGGHFAPDICIKRSIENQRLAAPFAQALGRGKRLAGGRGLVLSPREFSLRNLRRHWGLYKVLLIFDIPPKMRAIVLQNIGDSQLSANHYTADIFLRQAERARRLSSNVLDAEMRERMLAYAEKMEARAKQLAASGARIHKEL